MNIDRYILTVNNSNALAYGCMIIKEDTESGAYHKCIALIDSGASRCIINSKIVKQYGLRTFKSTPIHFTGFQQSLQITSLESVKLLIFDTNKNFIAKNEFRVLPEIAVDILLSADFLLKRESSLQLCEDETILFNENEYFSLKRQPMPKLKITCPILIPGKNKFTIQNISSQNVEIVNQHPLLYMNRILLNSMEKCEVICYSGMDGFADKCNLEENLNIFCVNESTRQKSHYRKDLPLSPLDLSLISIGNATQNTKVKLNKLIKKYHYIFSRGTADIGLYNGQLKYDLELVNPILDSYKTREFSLTEQEFLDKEISGLLSFGVIEPYDTSQIYAGLVVVKKKNGKLRMCLDSRIVNCEARTNHNCPLPKLETLITQMANYKIYSGIDYNSAYWQIELPEHQRHLYTFCYKNKCYRFVRSSFGTKNMSSFWTSVMNECFGNIKDTFIYMDDVNLAANSEEEMLNQLENIFEKIGKYNLTISLEKCTFFQKTLIAFGYKFSEDGFKPTENRIEKLKTIPTPNSKKSLQKALGSLNYYRHSTPNFKFHAAPLYERIHDFKRNDPVVDECWTKLIKELGNVITRNRPDIKYPLIVKTDASNLVTGCCITQKIENKEQIILVDQFILRGRIKLSKISHKELFAVYIAFKHHRHIIERFNPVYVHTDNKQVFITLKNLKFREAYAY